MVVHLLVVGAQVVPHADQQSPVVFLGTGDDLVDGEGECPGLCRLREHGEFGGASGVDGELLKDVPGDGVDGADQ